MKKARRLSAPGFIMNGSRPGSEDDLGDELDGSGVAREVGRPLLEVRVVGLSEHPGGGLAGQLHRIDQTSRILSVVEEVGEVAAEFEVSAFRKVELLANRNIEVVDAWHQDRVAAGSGQCTRAC